MATASIQSRLGLIAMSTAASAGGTNAFAELRNCTIRVTQDVIDVTSNDSSGWRSILPGTRSWRATAEALYVPSTADAGYLVRNALSSGSSMAFLFQPSTGTAYSYTGTAHIGSWEIAGNDPSGAFAFSVEIEGHEGLTFSTST